MKGWKLFLKFMTDETWRTTAITTPKAKQYPAKTTAPPLQDELPPPRRNNTSYDLPIRHPRAKIRIFPHLLSPGLFTTPPKDKRRYEDSGNIQ